MSSENPPPHEELDDEPLPAPEEVPKDPASVRRQRVVGIAFLSTLALAFAAWQGVKAFRASRVEVVYCATTVERFGVETCVDVLTPEIVKRRTSSFRQTSRGGRVERIDRMNGHGALVDSDADGAFVRSAESRPEGGFATVAYSYGDDGRAREALRLDHHGTTVMRISILRGGARIEQHDTLPTKEDPTSVTTGRATAAVRRLDTEGYVVEEMFLSPNGLHRPDATGVYGHGFERDVRGLVTRRTNIAADGEPMLDDNGVVYVTFESDARGEAKHIAYFAASGAAALSKDGVLYDMHASQGHHLLEFDRDATGNVLQARELGADGRASPTQPASSVRVRYDDQGDPIEITNAARGGASRRAEGPLGAIAGLRNVFDERGNAIEIREVDEHGKVVKGPWSIRKRKFDARDDVVEEATFDGDEHASSSRLGASIVRMTCDAAGRMVRLACFDENGKPTRGEREGVFAAELKRDPRGRLVAWISLDAAGLPTASEEGPARVDWHYDELGEIGEIVRSDVDGRPAKTRAGAPMVRSERDASGDLVEVRSFDDAAHGASEDTFSNFRLHHDVLGREVERTYLDGEGKPIVTKAGFVTEAFEYDHDGRVVSIRYLDGAGASVVRDGGYAAQRFKYDVAGRLIETRYLDAGGEPSPNKEGFAIERLTLGPGGEVVDRAYFGVDGAPVSTTAGCARVHVDLDERGHPAKESMFGVDGSPVVGRDGHHAIVRRFDELDHRVEEAYLDAAGEPIADKSGVAIVRDRYDEHGDDVETTYLDASGEPAKRAGGGYARVTRTFDARHDAVEVAYFDASGAPIAGDEGAAVVKRRFDPRGHVVEQTRFDAAGLILVPTPSSASH